MNDSVEATPQPIGNEPAPAPAPEAGVSLSEDDELGAVFDTMDTGEDPRRDAETGRYKTPEEVKEELEASPVEGEGEAKEEAPEPSTPEASEVPLPSNWQGMEETWGKIPEEIRHDIAARELELHRTMSDQGREIGAMKPVNEVIEQNASQFAHMTQADGSPVSPQDAISYLFQVNRDMTANPVETILQFADTFNVREQVAAKLNGGQPSEGGNESVLLEKIAGLETVIRDSNNPARVDQQITQRLQQDQNLRDGEALISRLSKDMPLYAEIPEPTMVQFINMAQASLGETASSDDVFKSAYDMAVNAIPALRVKLAAAQPAAKADPEKVAAAKRANGVNVTSTSTGKSRSPTDEEELGDAYDKAQRK